MHKETISFIAKDVEGCFSFLKKENYKWKDNDYFPDNKVEMYVKESMKNDVGTTTEMILMIDENKEIYRWNFKEIKDDSIYWIDLKEEIRKDKIKRLLNGDKM